MTVARLRGVSELVSAALLAIIVVTVGAIVVLRIMESALTGLQAAQSESLKAVYAARQALAIAVTRLDASNGALTLIVATGDFPVDLQAVYINETLQTCTVSWGQRTATLSGSQKITLPSFTLARITCPISRQARFATVKIVYEGGEASAMASS